MKGSYVEVSHTLLSRVKGLTDNLASAGVNLTGQLEDEEKTSSLGKQLLIVFPCPCLPPARAERAMGPTRGLRRPPPSLERSSPTPPRASHLRN